MSAALFRPGITIFAGRFGSGKTEASINYALALAGARGAPGDEGWEQERDDGSGREVFLIDLDIVTPYFRSRETAERMKGKGVAVIGPSIVGQHLDMPAITPQILGAIQQVERPAVLDVGGDKQGARALGQFSAAIDRRGYVMHFVVNPYRPFTDTLAGLSSSIAEIEASARLRVTDLVSNPNLMGETTDRLITDGHAKIESFARALQLPVAFLCVEQGWLDRLGAERFGQRVLVLERYFVMSWE